MFGSRHTLTSVAHLDERKKLIDWRKSLGNMFYSFSTTKKVPNLGVFHVIS